MTANAQSNLKLWYKKPAKKWTDAIPIGNGRIGAMIFGRIQDELIQLNEDTFWSGYPKDLNNYDAKNHLEEVRKLIFEGKPKKAQELMDQKMLGTYMQPYLPFGDLKIKDLNSGKIKNYIRELDLSSAKFLLTYEQNDVKFRREFIASHPDQALFIKIYCPNNEKKINISLDASSPVRYNKNVEILQINDKNIPEIILDEQAPSWVDCYYKTTKNPINYDDDRGMKGRVKISVLSQDGKVEIIENKLQITDASNIFLSIVMATSFNGFDKDPVKNGKDPILLCDQYLERIINSDCETFEEFEKNQIADYSELFNRVSIDLGESKYSNLPTDVRIKRLKKIGPTLKYYLNIALSSVINRQKGGLESGFQNNGKTFDDLQLITLYYQFGRYLMISASRNGTQPMNLQGIWNPKVRPPWASNYTININTEMNYWPAQTCNLGECHEPLIQMIKELAVNGKVTAKGAYDCNGWCAHHNTGLWRNTNIVARSSVYAFWPFGGAWLAFDLWEKFQFTLDKDYLETIAYPLLKGCVNFIFDWLIEGPDGYLVTTPSTSPENKFKTSDGGICSPYYASTCDMAIIKEIFKITEAAAQVLGVDKDLIEKIDNSSVRLYPYKIGKHGQIQEWAKDFEEREPGHRHKSHLIGVHPGSHITPENQPELANAAKNSILRRVHYGGGATGWSCAWKINIFARLKDEENTYNSICTILRNSTYPNLFDAHPPFQIDGNFGAIAGIAEMLIQSHAGFVEFLPALPKQIPNGSADGLKIRGNCAVDLTWKNNSLEKAILYPNSNVTIKIKINIPILLTLEGKDQNITQDQDGFYPLKLEKGKIYEIAPVN